MERESWLLDSDSQILSVNILDILHRNHIMPLESRASSAEIFTLFILLSWQWYYCKSHYPCNDRRDREKYILMIVVIIMHAPFITNRREIFLKGVCFIKRVKGRHVMHLDDDRLAQLRRQQRQIEDNHGYNDRGFVVSQEILSSTFSRHRHLISCHRCRFKCVSWDQIWLLSSLAFYRYLHGCETTSSISWMWNLWGNTSPASFQIQFASPEDLTVSYPCITFAVFPLFPSHAKNNIREITWVTYSFGNEILGWNRHTREHYCLKSLDVCIVSWEALLLNEKEIHLHSLHSISHSSVVCQASDDGTAETKTYIYTSIFLIITEKPPHFSSTRRQVILQSFCRQG